MISGVVLRAQSDARLAALAVDGSEPAFEAIVQRYRRALLAYCRRLLLSDSRSEDVVQQAFLNAWEALRSGADVRELRPWLYRITHNEAMRALRRPGYDFAELTVSLHGLDAPDCDLERRVLMRETLAAVAALPDLQREAILRTAVDGNSYEQVALALGLTDTAVRGLVYRARAALRAGLAVFSPPPLVLWAAGSTQRGGGVAQWLSEVVAGGGSAGGAAVVIKTAGVLATSAVVVGGTVGSAIDPHLFAPPAPPRAARLTRPPNHRIAAHRVRTKTGSPVGATRQSTRSLPASGAHDGSPKESRARSDLTATTSTPSSSAGVSTGGKGGSATATGGLGAPASARSPTQSPAASSATGTRKPGAGAGDSGTPSRGASGPPAGSSQSRTSATGTSAGGTPQAARSGAGTRPLSAGAPAAGQDPAVGDSPPPDSGGGQPSSAGVPGV